MCDQFQITLNVVSLGYLYLSNKFDNYIAWNSSFKVW